MPDLDRRTMLASSLAIALPGMISAFVGCQKTDEPTSAGATPAGADTPESPLPSQTTENLKPMQIHYLEIVTPEVEALCAQYSSLYDITFSEPDANLGNARTAKLNGGGVLGIRGPLRDTETPVVRPYMLVDDIESAVATAADSGATVALPPMDLPGHGTCAIVIHGGIECGLWQLASSKD